MPHIWIFLHIFLISSDVAVEPELMLLREGWGPVGGLWAQWAWRTDAGTLGWYIKRGKLWEKFAPLPWFTSLEVWNKVHRLKVHSKTERYERPSHKIWKETTAIMQFIQGKANNAGHFTAAKVNFVFSLPVYTLFLRSNFLSLWR